MTITSAIEIIATLDAISKRQKRLWTLSCACIKNGARDRRKIDDKRPARSPLTDSEITTEAIEGVNFRWVSPEEIDMSFCDDVSTRRMVGGFRFEWYRPKKNLTPGMPSKRQGNLPDAGIAFLSSVASSSRRVALCRAELRDPR
jgi:hypothetical protein